MFSSSSGFWWGSCKQRQCRWKSRGVLTLAQHQQIAAWASSLLAWGGFLHCQHYVNCMHLWAVPSQAAGFGEEVCWFSRPEHQVHALRVVANVNPSSLLWGMLPPSILFWQGSELSRHKSSLYTWSLILNVPFSLAIWKWVSVIPKAWLLNIWTCLS